jgi:hypothetical protein
MAKSKTPVAIALPEDGIAPALYNHVVANAELVTIQLRRHEFDVDGEFYNPDAGKKLSFGKVCLGCTYDQETSMVAGTFRFNIGAKSGRKAVLKSVADYLVAYEFAEVVDEEAAKAFCTRVGLYAAYPYYRALVASLSASANLNLPTLPMIATRGVRLPEPTPDV